MAFCPKVLQPTPDPDFVRQLKKIDPELRVDWGYERYLKSRWVIERKLSAERYWESYASLIESGAQRYVDQPIYDTSQPILDENGDLAGFTQIGTRKFDLAPEYECVMFVEEDDGAYRELDTRTLLALRRVYCWERFHSLSRAKLERQMEQEAREAKSRAANVEACLQEIIDHRRELLDLPFSGSNGS